MTASVHGLTAWILVALGLGLQGKEAAPAVAPFQGRLAEATALAKERNVPLLTVAFFEDEAWTAKDHHDEDGLRRALLEEREWAQALERGLLVLASNRVHELETVVTEEQGQRLETKRCRFYRTPSCSVHQLLFEDVYSAYNEDGALVTPFILLQDPGGQVQQRWSDSHTPPRATLLAAFEAVRKKAGAGLNADEYRRILSATAGARSADQRGDAGAAWRAWAEVLSISQTTPHAEQARAAQPKALAALEAARAAAQSEVEAGRPVEGYKRLAALCEGAKQTPLERELAKSLRALESDKQHRAAIEAYKREVAAQALLDQAAELLGAGEERQARACVQQLLRKFADTPAAASARERYPGLIGDGG
jgi:hypothetical protein